MAEFVAITKTEMHDFLVSKRFFPIIGLKNTSELVYGRIVADNICLRVYTSIVGALSRDNGDDAIRVVLVTKTKDGIKIIGSDKRVHRVLGWRNNLQRRLDNWRSQLGPSCPKCGAMTTIQRSRSGPFYGCICFPVCRGSRPFRPVSPPMPSPPSPVPSPPPVDGLAVERQMDAAYQQHEAEQERKAYESKMQRDYSTFDVDQLLDGE